MIKNNIIEENPISEPAPWISNSIVSPKPDGSLRMTLDARNINKAVKLFNFPNPRHEDTKAKFKNAQIFFKMDFKLTFWQLELHPDSWLITMFYANTKLLSVKALDNWSQTSTM